MAMVLTCSAVIIVYLEHSQHINVVCEINRINILYFYEWLVKCKIAKGSLRFLLPSSIVAVKVTGFKWE